MGKTWLIASGKGGVGKSTLSACLGIALGRLNRRVCIVDADIGLRDQDALLGLENRVVYDVVDVCNKSCRLQQALLTPDGRPGLSLLPAAQFARCKELNRAAFARVVDELRQTHDDVLIDCPAGVERGLRATLRAHADETIVVCTPDDVCIRNAERTASLLEKKQQPRPWLVVNRLSAALIAAGEMYPARVVAETLDLPLLGEVPEDNAIYRAQLTHRTAMDVDCEAQKALMRIARRMAGETIALPAYGTHKLPWYKRLFSPALPKLNAKEVSRLDD